MNIVVLSGGLSMEREVSLASGSLIANALMKKGHSVVLCDLYYGIKKEDMVFRKDRESYVYKVKEEAPNLNKIICENGGRSNQIGENVLELCKMADVTFMALHGGVGENGKLQALFEMEGIKFTGSNSLGCMLAMDKIVAKEIVRENGVPTADWIVYDGDKEAIKKMIPLFIKPSDNGSSVGVTGVNSESQIDAALDEALKYTNRVICEKKVFGREFSVGVVDGKALPPIEIVAHDGFYSYKTKYQSGLATETCPANITKQQDERARKYAEICHKALCLGTYSRIDFIMQEDGEFFFLEANALPGMTPTSLLPQEAKVVGIDYHELCMKIIELTI